MSIIFNKLRVASLSELAPIVFNTELTHLGSEAFNLYIKIQKPYYKNTKTKNTLKKQFSKEIKNILESKLIYFKQTISRV